MANFTPIPWKICKHKDDEGRTVVLAGEYADMGEPDTTITVEGYDEDIEKANAKLIAAAPEMYQALKDIVEARGACVLLVDDPVDQVFDKVAVRAKAVIEKVEGVEAGA